MGNINDAEANIERKPKEAQLLFAAENGHIEKLHALLAEKEVKVDSPNSSAVTALFLAAKEGHEECLRLLLEAGASVDGIGLGNTALTPLWVATYAGHKNCVDRLVKAGANLSTKFPETPLFIAAREGRADCLKILIEAGSNVNVKNNRGQNPMHIACSEVHESCVEHLVSGMSLSICYIEANKRIYPRYISEWQSSEGLHPENLYMCLIHLIRGGGGG